jgi:DNA polymerase-3 subunit epsilon
MGLIHFKIDGSIREWGSFINPGMPIPREATYGEGGEFKGHGITDDMVAQAPTFADLAPNLVKGFTGCDFGGFNIKFFDLPLIKAEFARVGIKWDYEGAKIIDCYKIWTIKATRRLSDGVEHFLGRKHEGAHRAVDDVKATVEIFAAQQARWSLPADVEALHQLQWPIDPNAIDAEGKIVWKNGAATLMFGKNWKGKRLDLMSRRDLTWIVENYHQSPSVQKICADALEGRFPVVVPSPVP